MKERKTLKDHFYKIESRFYVWLFKNRYKVFLLVAISFLFWLASSIPYLNLLFKKTILMFVVLYLSLILFVRSLKTIIILGIIFILLSYPLLLIGETGLAAMFGDFAFGIFLISVVYSIFDKKNT